MYRMATVDESHTCDGEIVGLHTEAHILWKIHSYFSQQRADSFYDSPLFHFLGSTWSLRIYPNGQRKCRSVGYIGLHVFREKMFEKHDVFIKISIVCDDDKLSGERSSPFYSHLNPEVAWNEFMDRRFLLSNQFLFAPHGTLRIIFVGKLLQKESLPLHKASQTKIIDGMNGLSQDFKNLLRGEQATDVVIRVKTRVFPAHKLILGARSTVFAAMFKYDMKEKITGSVNIEDCDPAIFQKFLSFMYTGKIDDLTTENVIDVFSLANKYDLGDLRQICMDFMKENLCQSMACNVLAIADKFNLEELKKSATELIIKDINFLMSTENWIHFIRDNPELATEILMKAFSKV